MTSENALATYKTKPAPVKEKAQDKIVIALSNGEKIKVREKSTMEVIHPGRKTRYGRTESNHMQGPYRRGSTDSLSIASTANTHSCTR